MSQRATSSTGGDWTETQARVGRPTLILAPSSARARTEVEDANVDAIPKAVWAPGLANTHAVDEHDASLDAAFAWLIDAERRFGRPGRVGTYAKRSVHDRSRLAEATQQVALFVAHRSHAIGHPTVAMENSRSGDRSAWRARSVSLWEGLPDPSRLEGNRISALGGFEHLTSGRLDKSLAVVAAPGVRAPSIGGGVDENLHGHLGAGPHSVDPDCGCPLNRASMGDELCSLTCLECTQ